MNEIKTEQYGNVDSFGVPQSQVAIPTAEEIAQAAQIQSQVEQNQPAEQTYNVTPNVGVVQNASGGFAAPVADIDCAGNDAGAVYNYRVGKNKQDGNIDIFISFNGFIYDLKHNGVYPLAESVVEHLKSLEYPVYTPDGEGGTTKAMYRVYTLERV